MGVPAVPDDDLDAIEAALASLLRLGASRRVFAERAASAGVLVSQPGADLLGRLGGDRPLTLGELGRTTQMDPSAVGRQIRRLEAQGLILREADADDRRVIRVRATPRGQEVRRRLASAGRGHVSEALAEWTPSDRDAIARLLPKLVASLRAHRYPNRNEETA